MVVVLVYIASFPGQAPGLPLLRAFFNFDHRVFKQTGKYRQNKNARKAEGGRGRGHGVLTN